MGSDRAENDTDAANPQELRLVEAARQYRTLVSPVYGDDDERGAAEELDAALNAYDGRSDADAHAGASEAGGLRGMGGAPADRPVSTGREPEDLLRDVPGRVSAARSDAREVAPSGSAATRRKPKLWWLWVRLGAICDLGDALVLLVLGHYWAWGLKFRAWEVQRHARR